MPIQPLSTNKLGVTNLDYRPYATTEKWQFYDRVLEQTSFYPSAGTLADLNNDGQFEYIFTLTVYPFKQIPIAILGNQNGLINLTQKYFPAGAPTVGHPSFVHYLDVSGDGKRDIVVSEAGFDYPPWTGSRIGVGLNTGGSFTNISDKVPDTTSRAYAVGIADFDNDGRVEILIPGQGSNDLNDSYLLKIVGTDIIKTSNPLENYLQQHLNSHTAIVTDDFNNDGINDLLFSGNWVDRNNRLIYGTKTGFDTSIINVLPAGPLGESAYLYYSGLIPPQDKLVFGGPEVYSIALDINNDGLKDVFSVGIQSTSYPAGTYKGDPSGTRNNNNVEKDGGIVYGPTSFWVTRNTDGESFIPQFDSNNNLGDIYYRYVFPFDINADGRMDVIGHYWTIDNPKQHGTTFFINRGTGSLEPIDAAKLFPSLLVSRDNGQLSLSADLGWIVPLKVNNDRLEGIQITKDEVNNGIFSIQSFEAIGITSIKQDPKTAVIIADRNNIRSIEGSEQKDLFYDTNSHFKNNPPTINLNIALELIARNIKDIPNVSIIVNGNTVLDRKPIVVDPNGYLNLTLNLTDINPIKSLALKFDSLKYVDQNTVSYVIIRKFSCMDMPISFSSATFSNGFAFNDSVAQANGDGTITFNQTDSFLFNSKIVKLMDLARDIVDGGSSIDQSFYSGEASKYSIGKGFGASYMVLKEGSVNDVLYNIERLKFSDRSLAIDLDGNSGNAARLLATVFGKDAVKNPTYAGIAISLFDQGFSKDQVSQVALNAVFGANPKSKDIVSMIWKNLTGSDIDSKNLADLSGLIDSQAITAAQLATKAADLDLTAQVIDLVGLSKTGWEYIPYGG